MRTMLGLGGNLGDRRASLEAAASALKRRFPKLRLAPVFETPAMMPEDAPDDWNRPFLNTIAEIDFNDSPHELLRMVKTIEADLGREPTGARWAPRPIDIDILWMDGIHLTDKDLNLPHIGLEHRGFVLAPLKEFAPDLILSSGRTSLQAFRTLAAPLTAWMTVVNATPDSFSDGGAFSSISTFEALLDEVERTSVQIVDVGAESTRPNGSPVPEAEEWSRLRPFLEAFVSRFASKLTRPRLSVDTRHAGIAKRALGLGADIINDVSFGRDPAMVDVIGAASCDYCISHSVTAPVEVGRNIPASVDVVAYLKQMALEKLDTLSAAGIPPARIVFDPGVGFGKTRRQNFEILKRIADFLDLPCRIAIGHSRKGFMNLLAPQAAAGRDAETMGLSMGLAMTGVDWIRVHQGPSHARAALALRHLD